MSWQKGTCLSRREGNLMTEWRFFVLVVSASVLAGCQTASLEDAAPRGAVVASQPLPAPVQPGNAIAAEEAETAFPVAPAAPDAPRTEAETVGASTVPTAAVEKIVRSQEGAPRQTADGFTNFNVMPDSAAAPLSPADKRALLLRLRAAQAKARGASVSTAGDAAEIARLRKLARQHGIDAIKEIEGE
jgi:hypothetical protein